MPKIVRQPCLLCAIVEQEPVWSYVTFVPLSPSQKNFILPAQPNVYTLSSLRAAFFESHNFGVRTATDGITALRWFSTWQPEAAMLDIDTPGANGYEVARHVRCTENSGKRTLLVAITGEMPPQEVAARCHEPGF